MQLNKGLHGSSVLAVKFDGGVLVGSDTLCSYGSLAHSRRIPRICAITDKTVVAAGGDYADFQYLRDLLLRKADRERCEDFRSGPRSTLSFLARLLYGRRSQLQPLWVDLVVAGVEEDGSAFLGCVDKLGMMYTAPVVATGLGSYLALPLLRTAAERRAPASLSLADARSVLGDAVNVLYYRDARTSDSFQMCVVTDAGVNIEEPQKILGQWNIAL